MPKRAHTPCETDQRMDRMAQLVADGLSVQEAGCAYLGLTRGQTSRVWMNIKRGLGEQAR